MPLQIMQNLHWGSRLYWLIIYLYIYTHIYILSTKLETWTLDTFNYIWSLKFVAVLKITYWCSISTPDVQNIVWQSYKANQVFSVRQIVLGNIITCILTTGLWLFIRLSYSLVRVSHFWNVRISIFERVILLTYILYTNTPYTCVVFNFKKKFLVHM